MVIAHEYIHTVSGAMNHGRIWKYWVGVFNRKYRMDLTRIASAKELGIDEYLLQSDMARQPKKCLFSNMFWNVRGVDTGMAISEGARQYSIRNIITAAAGEN